MKGMLLKSVWNYTNRLLYLQMVYDKMRGKVKLGLRYD